MIKYNLFIINICMMLCLFMINLAYAEGELSIRPGKYKLIKTTKTNFDSAPVTRTTEECITNPNLDPQSILPDKENCRIENLKTAENSTSFDFICTEQGNSSSLKGKAKYSVDADIITSNFRLEGLYQGEELIVESTGKGQRLGDCLPELEFGN